MLMRCERVELVTLDDARGAGAFYRRLGWTREHVGHGSDGGHLALYSLDLAEPR